MENLSTKLFPSMRVLGLIQKEFGGVAPDGLYKLFNSVYDPINPTRDAPWTDIERLYANQTIM